VSCGRWSGRSYDLVICFDHRRPLGCELEAFTAADVRVAELSKQIVRARIGGGVPSTTNFGKDPEWGALSHEVNKRVRRLPLRQLFGKSPTVLTKLAPV
jgi:hypothetical protein